MAQLEHHFLGPYRVTIDGKAVEGFAADKVRALLAYLAVEGEQPLRREALAGLLWPDSPEQDAAASFRKALHRLRQALGEDVKPGSPTFLLVTSHSVQLNPGTYKLDVTEFTNLIRACRTHRHRKAESCVTCHSRLRRAADLYRGDFLTGFILDDSQPFDEWLMLNRERLRRQALDVFGSLAIYHERRGEYEQALVYAHSQIELEPWREEAHCQVMRLLALDGQRSAALAQYETCRRVLLQELGVEPEGETTALYESIKSGILESGSDQNSSKIQNPKSKILSHNLPKQTSPFIGREEEIARIIERLDSVDCQLLTLVGTGGVGKTRLALQVATEQVGAFDDGVWFVPLASLNTSALLVSSIAQAVGLRFAATGEPEAQLLDYLRNKEMLLVLDNFEQLVGSGTDLLVAIVKETQRVSLLVTSRERLALQAEYIFDVEGLPLPATKTTLQRSYTPQALAELQESSAVQLFVERAQQIQWQFALSQNNAREVADICGLVAGLPLGILLAAASIRHTSAASIASSIRENLDFLVASARDATPAHRSLRAIFNHSWNLLSEDERAVFCRLSVFSGGWEEAAAENVAGASTEILQSLSDKSLLRQDATGRFEIHGVLRRYAAEQLSTLQGAHEETAARHAIYFLDVAEQAEQALLGSEQGFWIRRLDTEHDNIRAGLRWATSRQQSASALSEDRLRNSALTQLSAWGELALRLASAMWRFWDMQGYASEGREHLAAALNFWEGVEANYVAPPTPNPFKAKALSAGSSLARIQGDNDAARQLSEESLLLYQQLGDKAGIAKVLNIMGLMVRRQGDYATAIALYKDSLEIQKELGNKVAISALLNNLGNVAHEQRDYVVARQYHEESLLISKALGDKEGIAATLGTLGLIAHDQEDYEQARILQEESLTIRREIGNKRGIANAISNLAEVAYEQEDYVNAYKLAQESLTLREELRDKRDIAFSLIIIGQIMFAQGDHSASRSSFVESLKMAWELGDKYVIFWCLEGLAALAAREGSGTGAQRAAHLWGAATSLREELNSAMPPNEHRRYEAHVAASRKAQSAQAFDAAWAEGRTMNVEQIVTYALAPVVLQQRR